MTATGSWSPPASGAVASDVVFVTHAAAEPLTGSSTRAFHTIRALCDLGCRVHNLYLRRTETATPRLDALAKSCQRFSHSRSLTINPQQKGVFWLSDLWSAKWLQAAVDLLARAAASGDRWRVVVDLSDVLADDSRAKGLLDEAQLAEIDLLEGTLLRAADVAVWVSEREKRRAVELYGVDPAIARVIASFHQCPRETAGRGFGERRAAVCLAGSTHAHNKRACELGVTQIWPEIFAGLPAAALHVFGSGTEQIVIESDGLNTSWSRIRVLGAVENFIEKLTEYRVHMIPTVSGVGVKTKVFDSLVAGTPIVATPAALEGTELEPGEAVFVSDSTAALARRARELLTDQAAWNRAHAQAVELSARFSDFPRFRDTVREALLPLSGAGRRGPALGQSEVRVSLATQARKLSSTLLVSTHHKTGTLLAKKIFSSIAMKRGLRFLEVSKGAERVGEADILFDEHSRFDGRGLQSPLLGVHLIRDPRMVVVSAALYHVHSSEVWLHQPRPEFGGLTYQQKILSLGSDRERFLFEMDHRAGEVINDMTAWVARGYPWCMNVKLEDLMTDYRMEAYTRMFRHLGFAGDLLREAIDVAYEHSVFNPRHPGSPHIRSLRVEDWREYFDEALHGVFVEKFGDACQRLGYV